uniref:Uncharacterized protein n=1 Tax=Panagrolaimus sp. ES5 TaxID=591445 RepID=A0AC34GIE6_9BILA
MINIIEDVEFVVEKLVNNVVQGKIPKPVKPKRRPPRKNPNLSLDVRRSGRTSKEIPFEAMDSPVIGTFQQPTNAEPVTIRTLLGLPSNDSTFPPLDFPGAQGFPFDDLNDNIIPSFSLETFNVYLTTLLNKQHMPMEELLHSFLCFFSWNLPSGCQLTVEQQK